MNNECGIRLAASFPFGWVRNFREDNWQIIWDSKSDTLLLKSTRSERIAEYCKCKTWEEAKSHADDIRSNHDMLESVI